MKQHGDIRLTGEGDFDFDEDFGIRVATPLEKIEQTVRICIMTTNPDWYYDKIGADLEDLLGLPNSRETAEKGKTKIMKAIMMTDVVDPEDIHIEAKPTNRNTITFLVFIRTDHTDDPMAFRADMELGSDIQVRRVQ